MPQSDVDKKEVYDRVLGFVIGHKADSSRAAYIRDLVNFLCTTLKVEYAACNLINRSDPKLLETLVISRRGEILPAFGYRVDGLPCARVVAGDPVCVPTGLQDAFGADDTIRRMGADSYVAVPLWSADGHVLGLLCICDIGPIDDPDFVLQILDLLATRTAAEVEALRALDDLEAEKQRINDFSSVISDWYWETDSELRFSFLSEQFEVVTGIPSSALIGKTRAEIGAPGADPETFEELLQTMEHHKPFRDFLHYRDHPDGHRTHLSISGKPAFDAEGRFIGYRGVARDVSAYVLQSQELTRLSDQSEKDRRMIVRLINGIPALVAYVNPSLEYAFGNFTFREWFGEDNQALAGRPVRDVHEETTWEKLIPLLERALAGETVALDIALPGKDGRIIEIEGVIEPDKVDEQAIRGVYVFGADVTERRQAERGLRAAELSARRSDRAKSQFLANMSHELRSPLNSIIGFSEIMSLEHFGPMGNDRYREYAEGIQAASRHLLAVISDILDLSKVEAGVVELEEDTVAIDALVAGTLTIVKPLASAKNQTIAAECDLGSVPVRGDERLLRQVLVNLLSNAIKFSPEDSIIRVRESFTAADGLLLSVEDHGIGIPDDQKGRVFEPFGQVRDDAMMR